MTQPIENKPPRRALIATLLHFCPSARTRALTRRSKEGALITPFLIDSGSQLEIDATSCKQREAADSNRRWIAILPFAFSTPDLRSLHSPARRSLGEGGPLITRRCSMLDFAQQFSAKEFRVATADRWNFGLCATIPREPRQARKGATVTGQLRVPRITRSSSYRCYYGSIPGLLFHEL